ncbi:MAG TPA: PAS domain S-box protein [Candidatus Binatia bacterium]|nr:PAS domain S-box protein [Candidatus Binatia bacterium]
MKPGEWAGTTAAGRFVRRFGLFTQAMSAVGMAIGVAVLIGWALDDPHLKSLQPGMVTMKPNDAVGLMLLSAALWLLREEPVRAPGRRIARACAAAAALLGLATLSEYAVGWDLAIDQLLFPESGNMIWTSHPGRMAPTSAVNLVLLGTALAMLDRPRRHWEVEVLTLLAVFISVFAYLAHVYALELLHGTGYYTHMAVHTAVAYCLLCAGVLTSRPQRGFMAVIASETPGGAMARRLLPATIVGPALLAWVGFVGQRSGYYGTVFGLALLALAIILAFSVLVLWSASSLYHVDLEREKAESALRASRERLRLMVDGAKEYAIFMLDPEGTVQSWNPGAERIHGYREEDIIGQPVSRFYTSEDCSRRKPQKDLVTAAREGAVEDEGLRIRNDGSQFWANAILTALRGDDGRLRGFAMLTRDVSERRKIEDQLKDANAELSRREEAVKTALADVTKTHEALKSAQLVVIQTEKMESVGRIAAGVAHEVKNPLAIILSGIDYLGEHANGDPVQGEVLREMEYAVSRADRILGGLLDFSAPRSLELHFESLNAVIDQALLLVKHELDRGRVNLVRELTTDLPLAWLDKRKIEQVFINVFLNSIQAMPKGGTLTVKTWARPAAEVGLTAGSRTSRVLKRAGPVVVAEVDDTGSGIPEELLRKIFEPFFTTKPTKKGTGLGLTVAKAIVEMHGGMVSISNRARGGVQVLITLRTKGDNEDVAQATAADR